MTSTGLMAKLPASAIRCRTSSPTPTTRTFLLQLSCVVWHALRMMPTFSPRRCVRAHARRFGRECEDGSWYYGESPKSRWIDNFHTGYNLGALQSMARDLESNEFDASIRRGFEFYRTNFFREDGAPKYFHNQAYPLDIHCVAQSILTLLAFKDLDSSNVELAHSVFDWAMKHMWDDRGFSTTESCAYLRSARRI